MAIETVYRLTLHYDAKKGADLCTVDAQERIATKLGDMTRASGVEEVENNTGGPCWGPYIIVESDNLQRLQEYEGKALRYLKRWKQIELY